MAATVHTVCQRASDTILIQKHSTSIKESCTFAELPNKRESSALTSKRTRLRLTGIGCKLVQKRTIRKLKALRALGLSVRKAGHSRKSFLDSEPIQGAFQTCSGRRWKTWEYRRWVKERCQMRWKIRSTEMLVHPVPAALGRSTALQLQHSD